MSNIKLNINVTLGDLVISPDGPGNVILTMANNEGRISETVNVNELKEALALLDLTVNGKKSHKKKESV